MVKDEEQTLPSKMFTADCTDKFTVVSPDNLTVTYTRLNLHDDGEDDSDDDGDDDDNGDDDSAGMVKADYSAPTNCLAYTFEISVINAGARGKIAIGFSRSRGHFKARERYCFRFLCFSYPILLSFRLDSFLEKRSYDLMSS